MSDKKSKFAAIGTFVENANPYVKAAATIMKGVSFFKNRSAERKRLRKLGKQYTEDLTSFTDDIIPETIERYKQQGEYYQQQGDLATATIYHQQAQQLEGGGGANLSYGTVDVRKGQAKSAMDLYLQQKAASTVQQGIKNQQALGDALNQHQMQIDAMGDAYAKQGLTVDEYNINTDLKYV